MISARIFAFSVVFSVLLIVPSIHAAPVLYHWFDDIDFDKGCSYYWIEKTPSDVLSVSNYKSLHTDSVQNVIGGISNGVWEYRVNRSIDVDCVIGNHTETSYFITNDTKYCDVVGCDIDKDRCKCETIVQDKGKCPSWGYSWVDVSDIDSSMTSKFTSSQLPIRYCADIEREYTGNGWRIVADHIPKFNDIIYDKYTWWDSSWNKMRTIQIQYDGTNSTMVNYSLLLNVSYDGNMSSDFSDLRFRDNVSGSEVHYWIMEKVDSSYADVWINVHSISNTSNTTVDMYYDNAAANDNSDGNNTFLLFDDFEGGTLNASTWNFAQSGDNWAYSVQNGYLNLTASGAETTHYTLNSDNSFARSDTDAGTGFGGYRTIVKMNMTTGSNWCQVATAAADYIGFTTSAGGSPVPNAETASFSHANWGSPGISCKIYLDDSDSSGYGDVVTGFWETPNVWIIAWNKSAVSVWNESKNNLVATDTTSANLQQTTMPTGITGNENINTAKTFHFWAVATWSDKDPLYSIGEENVAVETPEPPIWDWGTNVTNNTANTTGTWTMFSLNWSTTVGTLDSFVFMYSIQDLEADYEWQNGSSFKFGTNDVANYTIFIPEGMWGNVSWAFEANTSGGSNVSDTFRYYPREDVSVTSWDAAVAIIMFGTAAILIIIGVKVNTQHIALMILFIFGGLYMIGLGLGAMREIALAESAPSVTTDLMGTMVWVTTTTTYIGAVYFIIAFLYGVMKAMIPKKGGKKHGV